MNKGIYRNSNGILQTVEQSAANLNLGKGTVMKLAREAGAIVKIGRTVRIDQEVLVKHIKEIYAETM